eukprot:2507456-Pyramimonas_sp.AAC.1
MSQVREWPIEADGKSARRGIAKRNPSGPLCSISMKGPNICPFARMSGGCLVAGHGAATARHGDEPHRRA